jgi:hypothetical protein
MQVDRKYKGIVNIASTDATRHIINFMCVKRTGEETGTLAATDGKRLAIVPVMFDKTEEWPKVGSHALLSRDHWKQMIVNTPKRLAFVASFTEKTVKFIGGTEMPLDKDAMLSTFPCYEQVIPDSTCWQRKVVLSVDSKLLFELAQAVNDSSIVTLMFNGDLHDPLIVGTKEKEAIGVLMPCRPDTLHFAHKTVHLGVHSIIIEEKPAQEPVTSIVTP